MNAEIKINRMLNLPALLEYPLAREIMIGLVYGIALATTLAKPRAWSSFGWCLLVCLGGYAGLAMWQAYENAAAPNAVADHPWLGQRTLCRTWVLAGLVCSCRVLENARIRLDNFRGKARQFVISDLMILAGVLALFVAGIRQTTLSQREPVFWAGLVFIAVVLPGAVASFRVGLSVRALLSCGGALIAVAGVTFGLAWAETNLVQPGRILWNEALSRYACTIAAMMLPRILFQLVDELRRFLPVQPVSNEAFTPNRDPPRETAHDAPRKVPSDDAGGDHEPATEQTQPALRVFA